MRVRWHGALAALAGVRIAIPLIALAASDERVPGFPPYEFVGLTGDATGFYAAAREFMAAWGRLPVPMLVPLVLVAAAGSVAAGVAWRRRPDLRAWVVVAATAGFGLLVAVAVTRMAQSGAGVFGWSLVWSLPMLPYRALGFPLDPEIAFGFAVVLSLLANAATVVATSYVGFYATGRRAVGLVAASTWAFWPLLVGPLAGERAWENNTWNVDVGLAAYTEPLSTALTTVALAVLLSAHASRLQLAGAGVALSLAALVKLANALLAATAVLLVLADPSRRRAGPVLAAATLALLPVALVYWPLGYQVGESDSQLPAAPFSWSYLDDNWRDSLLFGPTLLVALVPLAVLGAASIASRPRWTLAAWILVPVVFHSFFRATFEHPRLLYTTLPASFALCSAGVFALSRAFAR
jgi:hypothetical protein